MLNFVLLSILAAAIFVRSEFSFSFVPGIRVKVDVCRRMRICIRSGTAKNIFFHPKYGCSVLGYDAIEPEAPVNYSKTIQSIKLDTSVSPDGTQGEIGGWVFHEWRTFVRGFSELAHPFEGANGSYLSVIEELIIGGEVTKIQEVPYQAAFFFYDYYFCAGCIISPTHILTAAHCLVFLPNPKGLTVRAGSAKMYSGGQVTKVKKFIIHPKFSLLTVDYDVAIAELTAPLKFSSVVQPVKIDSREPCEGEEVKVSGWGFTKETGPPSRRLRTVKVKMVDRKTCSKNYKNVVEITKRMVCASGDGKDACYGDSGGPLVRNDKLVGIVSSGEGCARKEFPGIYTNLANPDIRKFIKKETKM